MARRLAAGLPLLLFAFPAPPELPASGSVTSSARPAPQSPLKPPGPVAATPLEFLQRSLRRHAIVFLGDIHPLAEPKRLVASLIEAQPDDLTIDLLVLEVAAEQQQWIDRYLASNPEDPSLLRDHPRTLRAHWDASTEYLDIYRAVYRWNVGHPARRVDILAADLAGWPRPPTTAQEALGEFARRDKWMAESLEKRLHRLRQGRVLIFMGGYHGLKAIGGQVTLGQAQQRFDRWFAGHLLDRGIEIFTVLTDARQTGSHGATRLFDRLSGRSGENFAVTLDSTTDSIQEPLYRIDQGNFRLEFTPACFPLRTAVDAMLVLNSVTPISPLKK